MEFDESNLTEKQQKLSNAFNNFVNSNYFIYATYGVLYFNLRQNVFIDFLLRSDMVKMEGNVEVGITGAKIYFDLFFHLYLIPTDETKMYLRSTFPNSYSKLLSGEQPMARLEGIDYENSIVDEAIFVKYSNIETYNN